VFLATVFTVEDLKGVAHFPRDYPCHFPSDFSGFAAKRDHESVRHQDLGSNS
jgi:hypothetical protein